VLKTQLINGAKTGTILTLTTTAAILAATLNERKGAWGAINNVCHMFDGDDVEYSDEFSPRESSIGLAVNATAMGTWAVMYHVLFGKITIPKSFLTAALFTAGAYTVDYYIVPDRYTPGIEHKISKRAIFAIYLVLALTLALAPLWSRKGR